MFVAVASLCFIKPQVPFVKNYNPPILKTTPCSYELHPAGEYQNIHLDRCGSTNQLSAGTGTHERVDFVGEIR